MRFDELIAEYVIKTEQDKVRKHSSDDYGLGAGWPYLGGFYDDSSGRTIWKDVYGRVRVDLSEHVNFTPGSFEFLGRPGEPVTVHVKAFNYIGRRALPWTITDIPADIQPIIKNR